MLDLNCSIQDASAQSLAGALMLLHPERDLMERVLLDLDCHRDLWQSFVLAPTLLSGEHPLSLAILGCLRDLALG